MIEIPARVVRVEGDTAWVEANAPSSCGACGGKGCGSSLFARMYHPRAQEYPVDNAIAARSGDAVVVGIPDGALFKATLVGYLAPLGLMLVGAMLGAAIGDAGAVAGAVAGLVVAVFWLKRQRGAVRPEILRLGESYCGARN
jgi:sigma-E factor negative regulatory protein RseC